MLEISVNFKECSFVQCISGGKVPTSSPWRIGDYKEASAWLVAGYNVAVYLPSCRYVCIDIDDEISHDLAKENGLPLTYTEKTKNGVHYWYSIPESLEKYNSKEINGIELKCSQGSAKKVIICYDNNGEDIVEAPHWVLEAITYKEVVKKGREIPSPPINELWRHLDALNPDDYNEWISTGMSLYHEYGGNDEAFELWDAWSRKSPKYDGGTYTKWSSFATTTGENVVRIGTLIYKAAGAVGSNGGGGDRNGRGKKGKADDQSDQGGSTKDKIRDWIDSQGYSLRFNEVSGGIELNGIPVTDGVIAGVRLALHDIGFSRANIDDAILSIAEDNRYHPIKEYFDGLRSSGTSSLDYVAGCIKAGDAALTKTIFTKWMVGCVARVFEKHQNFCIVLEGPQGIGKSMLCRWLFSMNSSWFCEDRIDPENKDMQLQRSSVLGWEIPELDATTRRREASALKMFMSALYTDVRAAYAKYARHRQNIASFIATVNTSDYLVDSTGNRRFYPLDVTSIDFSYRGIPIDELWADVVGLYRSGYDFELNHDEKELQAKINLEKLQEDPLETFLNSKIEPDDGNFLPASDILLLVTQHHLQGMYPRISKAMKSLGYQGSQRRVAGKNSPVRGYMDCRIVDELSSLDF